MMPYFNHVTIDTGDLRISRRDEVGEDIIKMMREWWAMMSANKDKAINIFDRYLCKLEHSNQKAAQFVILFQRADKQVEVERVSICLHSRYKKLCWDAVSREGEPPEAPFIAAKFINPQFMDSALGDFERCIAWGFYDYVQQNKD